MYEQEIPWQPAPVIKRPGDVAPGVVATFQPRGPRQAQWFSDPASTSRTLSSALIAPRRSGRTTWLVTQVLRAIADAAPESITVIMWSSNRRTATRLSNDVLQLADGFLPATTDMYAQNGLMHMFGPQRSLVYSLTFDQATTLHELMRVDLVVIDDVESIPTATRGENPTIDLRPYGIPERISDQHILTTVEFWGGTDPMHCQFVGVEYALRLVNDRRRVASL
jgi:hypothetical protein